MQWNTVICWEGSLLFGTSLTRAHFQQVRKVDDDKQRQTITLGDHVYVIKECL